MDFFRRSTVTPHRLGVFSGSFHPPTLAHLALAHAALDYVDEVLFVLPKVFPHKQYEDVSFQDRAALLLAAIAAEPRFSAAATEGGLFLEIAEECRAAYGPEPELAFLCGRDAAERVIDWAYGSLPPIHQQLETYRLLVAARKGAYTPPPGCAHRIHSMSLDTAYDEISSTEVRRRIRSGEPWRHLVPQSIQSTVSRLYTP